MDPTIHMRALVLFLIGGCCVAATGCSNPARQRMIGTWEADFEMSEDDLAKMTPAANPIVAGLGKLLMKSFRADMQWEFADDDTAIASATLLGNTKTWRGKWQFVSGDEKSTKLRITFENEEPFEITLAFSDPDTFEAAPLTSGKFQINQIVKFKRAVATP